MAVLCVVNTGPMLIAVSITEMVILYKYVQPTNNNRSCRGNNTRISNNGTLRCGCNSDRSNTVAASTTAAAAVSIAVAMTAFAAAAAMRSVTGGEVASVEAEAVVDCLY